MGRAGRSGGGGGGGGRSFGGGGGRSFGGRSGGGGISRGGGSRSGAGMGRGPTLPPRRPPAGPHMGGGFGFGGFRPPRSPVMGPRHAPMRRGGTGCGCFSGITSVVVLLVLFVLLISLLSSNASPSGTFDVTRSSVARQPLPAGSVVETAYYTDELGWIDNPTKLTSGMRNFYQKTGVQPHLLITDTIAGTHTPAEAQVEQYAMDTYDALFQDEAHLLLIFFEYEGNYHTWYMAGSQAKAVLDQEAMDILLDYVDRYYYSDMADDEMFSKAFNDAGDRIMTVTRSPWIAVLLIAGIIIIAVILFIWWGRAKKQRNLEAEQMKDILDTPLETFGTDEAAELAKKYEKSDSD